MWFEKFLHEDSVEQRLKNETAQHIVAVARDLFFEKGYKSVTTREIASKACVNLGLITYYFSSKENLGVIIWNETRERIFKEVMEYKIPNISSAVNLYIYNLLWWKVFALPHNSGKAKFYFEFIYCASALETPSDYFMKLSACVVEEYKLKVTSSQQKLYCAAMKGTERLLLIKTHKKELDIKVEDVVRIALTHYFYDIGLSNEIIASVIAQSERVVSEMLPHKNDINALALI